jgi:H+-translocating NAD(P) transhydrogenase subunit alpha
MKVVVLKESRAAERRVAAVPETVTRLHDAGAAMAIEAGAGAAAGFTDGAYADAGATVSADGNALLADADVLLCVNSPPADLHEQLKPGALLIGLLQPYSERDRLESYAARGVTALAMELVPRITRAQRMDVLSSQATVAGYKAALLAATRSNRFFPMLMTAAGTIPPARVLVLGAGVAGLQAIATARRLGAVVQGYDIRPAVKEQVESLGAKWVGLELSEAEGAGGYAKEVSEEAQRQAHEHLRNLVADADVVISTALIPGRPAPVLVTEDMVDAMRPGSVIIDLAAEAGGNCPLTRADEELVHGGVLILGPTNLPATMPYHASQMYARNIATLLLDLIEDGKVVVDLEDEVTGGCAVTHDGRVLLPR